MKSVITESPAEIKGTRDLIILGCGPSHVECKYDVETWGVNGVFTLNPKRLDKLFMSDEESEVDACMFDLPKMVEVCTELDTQMVLPLPYKKLVQTGLPIEVFPIKRCLQKFNTHFYCNSIAYMLAYALLYTQSVQGPHDLMPRVIKGYKKIYFYGIDMMTHSTYYQEKGGIEYWMGIAMGMGVEIVNTRSSATGKCWNGRMYGHFGLTEEELLKEQLYAPMELIRVSKASDPQDEWVFDPATQEYKFSPTYRKAGEEADRSRVKV